MGRRTPLSEIVCRHTNPAFARSSRVALASLFAAAALAAGCSSNPSQPDGGALCAQGVDSGPGSCAAGTVCTNSNCVPTCAAGGSCPPGFYCENPAAPLNVCSPIQTTSCAVDLDCPNGQNCAPGGICSSLEARADGTTRGCNLSSLPDGCGPDSLCYQIPSGTVYLNYCVGLSHCSEDGGCPNGSTGAGAVCNQLADGGSLFDGKERLCLYGFCVNDTHCPGGFACFHTDLTSPIGQCQQGLPGSPCYTYTDCFNSPTGCNVTLDGGVDGGQDDGGVLGKCY